MRCIPKPGQKAHDPCVSEVHLGGLDEALADVRKVGTQDPHLVGGLQDREPRLGGVHRDPEVAGQVGQVEELAATRRQCPQEDLEEREVAPTCRSTLTSRSR